MEESNPTQKPNPIPPPEAAPPPPTEQPPPPPPPASEVAQPPSKSQSPTPAKASPQPTSLAAAMPPPPPPAPTTMPPPPPPPAAVEAAAGPPPPPTSAVVHPPKSKKRPLDGNVQIQDCRYFKMRAVLKDIRPILLEVVRTVDFRNCKAADELRERLKLLMQLYKQLTAEAVTNKKSKISHEGQKLSNENGAGQEPQEQVQDVKPADQSPRDSTFAKPSEQSYYIGGSAFGWNFITYLGSKPVYYGRTKETFRAAQAAS